MTVPNLEAALAEEVRSVDAEETASATRAERAGEAARTPPPVPGAAPGAEVDGADALLSVVESLGEEQIAGLAVVVMDVFVTKYAGAKYELTAAERAKIAVAAVPVIRLYLPNIKMHPVTALALTAGAVYGAKALPAGGIASLLGGVGSTTPAGDTPPSEPAPAAPAQAA